MMENFRNQLQPWIDMLDSGLTTFNEVPVDWESQRSVSHPWSTNPNNHFFNSVCRIKPVTTGFWEVLIQSRVGNLEKINAIWPLPDGKIIIGLVRKKDNISGKINVEAPRKAILKWSDHILLLKEGPNVIDL